ncbi:eCIS core domain-containing protein [Phytobacter sp. V91]|uniref:eCIS core domain-containing protein n=1 Tax=Phytobacter sp. V91 TaxID=3369425 RepID=UPI003F5FA13B
MFSRHTTQHQSTRQAVYSSSVTQRKVRHAAMALEDNRAGTVQRQPNKTGLPDNLKSGMENISSMNLDHVKVHYNSAKPAAVQAHAYAQGSDIHLASGQEKHLPHELGHVVQQAQGRVAATTSVAGMAVNDSPALEHEADVMGGAGVAGGLGCWVGGIFKSVVR